MSKIFYAEKNMQWNGGIVSQGGIVKAKNKKEEKKAEEHKHLISEEKFLKAREDSLAAQRTTAADKYKEEAEKLLEEKEALAEELKELKAANKASDTAPTSGWDAKVSKAKADGYVGANSHAGIDKFYAELKDENIGDE